MACVQSPVSRVDGFNMWQHMGQRQCQCQHATNDMLLFLCWPHHVTIITIYWPLLTFPQWSLQTQPCFWNASRIRILKYYAWRRPRWPRALHLINAASLWAWVARRENLWQILIHAPPLKVAKRLRNMSSVGRPYKTMAVHRNNVLYFMYCSLSGLACGQGIRSAKTGQRVKSPRLWTLGS